MDTRSFHRNGRDIDFPCLRGYSKQERPPLVDHYIYKHFTYSLKSTNDKQASIFTKSFINFYSKASKVFLKCFVKDRFYNFETFSEKASIFTKKFYKLL